MAQSFHPSLHALRARKAEAEKALRLARLRDLKARTAVAAATGAAAVARRMVVEFTHRDLQRAAAEATAAAEALAAVDSRQIPLTAAWSRGAGPRRGEGTPAARPPPANEASSQEASEPLLAWARAHG